MDAYIINEIKKREREKLERENRPSLRIPFGPPPGWEPEQRKPDSDTPPGRDRSNRHYEM
ncbi:MAG: hypothetical protein ACXW30_02820 [Micavibrio sp.]